MITCESSRTFYELDSARWSFSENLFVLISKYSLWKKTKLLVLRLILYQQIRF